MILQPNYSYYYGGFVADGFSVVLDKFLEIDMRRIVQLFIA